MRRLPPGRLWRCRKLGAREWRWRIGRLRPAGELIERERPLCSSTGDQMRHRLFACAFTLVTAIPVAGYAQETTVLKTTCAEGPSGAASEPDLSGLWDFYMDVGGVPSFGLLSVGRLDGRYAGTLTPVRTAPVVVRSLTIGDRKVRMIVGSREGDVAYDAVLSGAGDRMCGIVTYHGGHLYPMVAQRRPQRSFERR